MEVETENIKCYIKDGILFARYKAANVDMNTARDVVRARLAVSDGIDRPVLLDVRSIKNLSKEARKYLGSPEACEFVAASAMIIESTVGKFIGNFFLQINRPPTPVKIFSNEIEGIAWLQQFKRSRD